jgi:hypothetical protein
MKLWLDDLRPAPDGFTLAKSRDEAIALLKTGEVEFASLDHDILWDEGGDGEMWEERRTGLAVVIWMRDHGVWPKDGVAVHSSNKLGRARMQALIDEHYQK